MKPLRPKRDAALFWAGGFAATSMRDVLSRGFPNRAVLERRLGRRLAYLARGAKAVRS